MKRVCAAVFAVFLWMGAGVAQMPAPNAAIEEVRSKYTKYEFRIPMRDGVRLFTAVYVPKDDSKTYPILLMRTPYTVRPYGADEYRSDLGPSPLFVKAGYIFAYQDVRGRWMSEGVFENMRPHNPNKKDKEIDESSDTYDTIDWLLKHVAGHNGKVGQWGISYPGFYAVCGMIDAHPALKATSPQAPVTDWFIGDDWHHNGAFQLPHAFNFMANFGKARPEPTKKAPTPFEHGTPDGYAFFLKMGPLSNANTTHFKDSIAYWNEVMSHPNYDDWWKARNIRAHIKNIKPAVLTVGGWFDAENLFGALETAKASGSAAGKTLVMGPWVHGGWHGVRKGDTLGHVSFHADTAAFYREQIEFPFFEFHLKGKGEFKPPAAWVFETGTHRWRKFDAWPPKAGVAKALHLRADGKLSWNPPSETDAFDEYLADPAKPVPYYDKTVIGMDPAYMTADQRFASTRPDVLVYETEILAEDLTLAGPAAVELHVSSTGTDADFVVKIIDVYPDDRSDGADLKAGVRLGGYQQLVRADIMRAKFRESFETPTALEPGKPTVIKFPLYDSLHTFRSGHKIMIQIQSSWFPLFDRNPQVFTDIYTAKATDFRKATQRVHRSRAMPSKVTLNVLP